MRRVLCISAVALLAGACSSGTSFPDGGDAGGGVNDAGISNFVLSCSSPLGAVTTDVTYTMVPSEEPAAPGDTVTYTLTPPDTVGNAPIATTFISSTSTYDLPSGLTVSSVTLAAASTSNYTSVTATLDGGVMIVATAGSFPVNGSIYPVPAITIVTQITAPAGSTISWEPPVSVVGQANASIVGTQTSSCQIESPSPLWVTHVVAK